MIVMKKNACEYFFSDINLLEVGQGVGGITLVLAQQGLVLLDQNAKSIVEINKNGIVLDFSSVKRVFCCN